MKFLFTITILLSLGSTLQAERLANANAQALVDERISMIEQWASDPAIVSTVLERNANMPAELADMTQEKWDSIRTADPIMRIFYDNDAAKFINSNRTPEVTEVFLSDANGFKIALLSNPLPTKTSGWCHAGKQKHDTPMSGQVWQGAIETDESTLMQQLQIAVPVQHEGKPIGSLVVGLSINGLREALASEGSATAP